MALPYCTIWRMGVMKAPIMKENHPSISPFTGSKDAGRPWPVHLCTSICTGRSRAGTSLCSCTWWWEPCKPEEEAATERWKTCLRRRWLFTKQFSVLTRQGTEAPMVPCLLAAVNQHLLAC